jgi:hypothetical protein
MSEKTIGFRSRLPNVVVELETKLGKRVNRGELAIDIGLSRQTLVEWMKVYRVMDRVDADTLYAILRGLEIYANRVSDGKVVFKKRPEEIVEFVGWEINKIEGLLAVGF